MPSEVGSGFSELMTKIVVRISQRRHDIRREMLILHLYSRKRRGSYLPLLSLSRRARERMRAVPYLLPESSLGKVLIVWMDLYDGKYLRKCDTFINSINTG